MLLTFFTPEYVVIFALGEWLEAKRVTKRVHGAFSIDWTAWYNHASSDDGYKWWTMIHSHFVLIGGFALRDDTGIKEIGIDTFLRHVQAGDILNPVIMEDDIKDKSTSDGLAKAILIVQLCWFATQIVVRLVNHLAVTLVELDTVCMALFTLPLIFCWWKKPRCPGRPYIFYMRNFGNNPNNQEMSQDGNDSAKLLVGTNLCYSSCNNLIDAH